MMKLMIGCNTFKNIQTPLKKKAPSIDGAFS
jgi:hypothetical protein